MIFVIISIGFIIVICLFSFSLPKMKSEKNEVLNDLYTVKQKNYKLQMANKNYYCLYSLKGREQDIKDYFQRQKIDKVVIYGMDSIGKGLARLLINADINVCYGIDRNPNIKCDFLKVFSLSEIDCKGSVIIVTPEIYYNDIVNSLGENARTIKMSEILEEILLSSKSFR